MNRFPSYSDNADYNESERARGARERPSPPPPADLHARVVAALREPAALPEFRHTPAAQAARAIPPPPPASAESRMSRWQLADRIDQMDRTTRAKGRSERPGAAEARAAKLARYRAELARRDAPAAPNQAAADRDARDADDDSQAQARAVEPPPVPPAAATAIADATARRVAVVATARAETLSALDRAVEALVRAHTSGAVIDAAWAASKRIFAPGGKRV